MAAQVAIQSIIRQNPEKRKQTLAEPTHSAGEPQMKPLERWKVVGKQDQRCSDFVTLQGIRFGHETRQRQKICGSGRIVLGRICIAAALAAGGFV
jgi:hypothetical protein